MSHSLSKFLFLTVAALSISGMAAAQGSTMITQTNTYSSGECTNDIYEHRDMVVQDGVVYSISSCNEEVMAHDVATGERLWFNDGLSGVYDIKVDGDRVFLADGNNVKILDADTGEQEDSHGSHGDTVQEIDVVGDSVYSVASDGKVVGYNVETQTVEWTHSDHTTQYLKAVGAKEGFVYSANADEVMVYDVEAGTTSTLHTQPSTNPAAGLDVEGDLVISGHGNDGGNVYAYNTSSDSMEFTYGGHNGRMDDLEAFNGKIYLTADEVLAYDIETESVSWRYSSIDPYGVEPTDTAVFVATKTSQPETVRLEVLTEVAELDAIATELSENNFYTQEAADFFNWIQNDVTGCYDVVIGGVFSCMDEIHDWIVGDDDEQIYKDDVRSNAIQAEDSREQIINESEMSLEQSFGMAQAEGKIEAVKQLNNNSTEAEALSHVRDTVEGFYSDMERRHITQYNREVVHFESIINTSEAMGVDFKDVINTTTDEFRFYDKEHELPNGETVTYIVVADDSNNILATPFDESVSPIETTAEVSDSGNTIIPSAKLVDGAAYAPVQSEMRSRFDTAVANVEEITSSVYSNYSAGELSVPDVVGPLEALQHGATSYNSTGELAYATISLEQMGLATDSNASFTIEYTNSDMDEAKNVSGHLFLDREAFSTLEVGTEYDASNKTAYVVAEAEEGAERINLDGTFTITEMIDTTTGEAVNSTEVESRTEYSSDIDSLQAQLDSIAERQKELQNDGGIGGGWFDIGLSETAIVALLLVVAGAFLA